MREWVDGWIGGWVGSTLSGLQPLLNVLLRDIICVMITKKEQQNIYCWFLASCNILLTDDTDNF